MKNKVKTIIAIVIGVVGLSLLLYPTVSNYINERSATKAIVTYTKSVNEMKREEYIKAWQTAVDYNKRLKNRSSCFVLPESEKQNYNNVLNVDRGGTMGYIEIPKIGVSLPIKHGTEEFILQHNAGHIEWSALPIGGAGTHCVLSGHRGLPSAKLFTDLDKLQVGDTFSIYVLNEQLLYEIDNITIIEPKDIECLEPQAGMDYCTLMTCTPYGINTHRLLVRGKRIQTTTANLQLVSEAVKVDTVFVALGLGLFVIIILAVILLIMKLYKLKKQKQATVNNGGKKYEN